MKISFKNYFTLIHVSLQWEPSFIKLSELNKRVNTEAKLHFFGIFHPQKHFIITHPN